MPQRLARLAGGDEAEHEVAGVGDARVGEHALEVALRQGEHVADHHREHGEDRHGVRPRLPLQAGGGDEQLGEAGERRRLDARRT